MKFIEVKDGVCISVKKIEAVTKLTDLTSLVYLQSGMQYEANFPYDVLIDIIESSEHDKESREEAVQEKLLGHLKFGQAFAG